MKGRLGTYNREDYDPNKTDPAISGIKDQETRLQFHGGNKQQERMIRDKRRSLDHATKYSYQGADVLRIDAKNRTPVRALINPNKLKQDYDDKIISIGYEYNFKCGDVFEWIGTNTHWLIYLQDLTELAYFRGDIRKCSYEITWKDEDGYHSSYAAIRGPVETKIDYIQKHGVSVDNPNYSLNLLMPNAEETLKYFRRYSKFYLQDEPAGAEKKCWRIEAIDWLSTPGILEVTAVEYYINKDEDNVEEGIAGDLIIKDENPNPPVIESTIIGETFIKPKRNYVFSYSGLVVANWTVDKKYPVIIETNPSNNKEITLKWNSSYSGQFELKYGDISKTIIVESLF